MPVVNIGSRQAGRDRGRNVTDVGYNHVEIEAAMRRYIGNGRCPRDPVYGEGRAGEKIAQLLAEVPLGIEKRLTY